MLKSIGLFNLQLEKTQGLVTEYHPDLWTWGVWGNVPYHHIFDVVQNANPTPYSVMSNTEIEFYEKVIAEDNENWNKLIKETA